MRVNGYSCDGQCGAQGVTKAHETRPAGWTTVYPDEGGSLHFCSWSCLTAYVERRRLPDLEAGER